MIKVISVNKSDISHEKWTPKYAYIFEKLKHSENVMRLDELLKYGPTNGVDSRDFQDNGRNYIRVSDMKRFFISYSDIKKVREITIPKKVKLQKNDILISRKGTPGISVLVSECELENLIGTEAILLRFKKDFDPYYLIAFFNSKMFYEQIINNLSGAVAKGINHPSLKKLKVLYDDKLVKPISDKMKEAIGYHHESLELISNAQMHLYQKLSLNTKKEYDVAFNVKLSDFSETGIWNPVQLHPLYQDTLEEIKSKFGYVSLNEIASIKKGNEVGSDNYIKYLDANEEDVPFIRTSDLVNYEVDSFPDFHVPEIVYSDLKQDIKPKDILFSNDGKIGMVAMLSSEDKVIIQSHIKRIRLKDAAKRYNITAEYLFLILTINEIAKYQAEMYTVIQSTIPTISNRIKDFVIPVLDKDDIDIISNMVEKSFTLKAKKKKIIADVKKTIDHYFDV